MEQMLKLRVPLNLFESQRFKFQSTVRFNENIFLFFSFQIASPTKGKKRQSSEGVDACNEKKPKENGEAIFNQRKANNYVVPSNAGCTPKNVNGGSSLSVSL